MTLKIQVRHDAAREAIQKYITAEFEHVAKKFTDGDGNGIVSAEFIVDQEGPNGHTKTFEAVVHVRHETLTVKEHSDETHKAIDASMKVLEKLLTKHKETYEKPGNLIRSQSKLRE